MRHTITTSKTPPNTPEDWMYKKIEELEARIALLENKVKTTVAVYDYNNLPDDAEELEVAILINAPDIIS